MAPRVVVTIEVVRMSASRTYVEKRYSGRDRRGEAFDEAVTSEYRHLSRGGPVQGFSLPGGVWMWLEGDAIGGLTMVRINNKEIA